MPTGKLDSPLRIFMAVTSGGALVPGLLPGAFVVTVVDPTGAFTATPAVAAATAQPGLYYFDVPAAFLSLHGVGQYAYTAVIASQSQTLSGSFGVIDPTQGVSASLTFDAGANTLRIQTWLDGPNGQDATQVENATVRLFDQAGAPLTTLATTTTPDAQGVFAFNVPAPAFPVGEIETYLVVTIQKVGPPTRTYTDIAGVTFSRTS